MSNSSTNNVSYFGNGTSRDGRLLSALRPEYVRLDDRKLHELLAFMAEYAKFINFYGTDNKKAGTWQPFFESDISVILASIISTDLNKIESRQIEAVNNFYSTYNVRTKETMLRNLFTEVLEMAQSFDGWYRRILEINKLELKFETIVESELFGIMQEKIIAPVQRLYAIDLGMGAKEGLGEDMDFAWDEFHSVWNLKSVKAEQVFKGSKDNERLHAANLQLRLLYRELHRALSYAVFHFDKYFYKSIEQKNDHKADMGLFITFLKLYRYNQTDFNKITERYLHYYYETFLQQKNLPAKPDKVHPCFVLSSHVNRFWMPAGTILEGGLDLSGEPLRFKTLLATEITHAKIADLKTVFVSRRDDVETSNYRLVTDIFAAPVANSGNGLGQVFEEEQPAEWPLFGEEQEYKPEGTETMTKGEIGFAVSSPMLFLREGEREVKITMRFDPKSTRILKKLVTDVREKVNEFAGQNDHKSSLEEVFYQRIFNQDGAIRTFKIFVTGKRGWIEADPQSVRIAAAGNGDWNIEKGKEIEESLSVLNALSFNFTIPKSKPAVVAFDPEVVNDRDYETPYPVVKIIVNERKQPHAYSFLQEMQVEEVNIAVDVKDMRRFHLYSEFGSLDARQPFNPFGAQPTIGSAFMIGNSELFRKQLTDFKLDIEWKDIPQTVADFKEHYIAYDEEYAPEEFGVKVSALSNRQFNPARGDDSTVKPLFDKAAKENAMDQTPIRETKIHITGDDLDKLMITPDFALADENEYDNETQSGYFRLELKGPDTAFGHGIWQEKFVEVVNKNARNPTQDPDKLPKQPYTPSIRDMIGSYTAETSFYVSGDDDDTPEMLYHVHPFGIVKTFRAGKRTTSRLLPQYEDDGYLYIGLENVKPPETVSFLFQLSSRRSKISTEPDLPEIKWSFLTNSEWRDFSDRDLLFDSTDNFTKSGIITIKMPRSLSLRHSMLPDGLCWLRVSVKGDTEVLGQAIDIRTQATIAERVLNDAYDPRLLRNPLPPYTLDEMPERPAEIQQIYQPFPGFNGKPAENTEEFFSRVSERLGHKGRVVTHRDAERMVLNEFPAVQQVKCLSSLSNPLPPGAQQYIESDALNIEARQEPPRGIHPREGLVIVAVPKKTPYINDVTPKFNYKDLRNIEDYLRANIQPFTKLRVVNPHYEYVRVIADIKFSEGMNNGMTLRRLQDDIRRLIAPWMFDTSERVQIGGSISENVLQNYIKGLEYVEFVTKFSLLHIVEENGFFRLDDTAEDPDNVSIIQTRPWGVLLPDDDHEIEMTEREEERAPVKRINTDSIIRFQNRVNILGGKKYIKVKRSNIKRRGADANNGSKKKSFALRVKL